MSVFETFRQSRLKCIITLTRLKKTFVNCLTAYRKSKTGHSLIQNELKKYHTLNNFQTVETVRRYTVPKLPTYYRLHPDTFMQYKMSRALPFTSSPGVQRYWSERQLNYSAIGQKPVNHRTSRQHRAVCMKLMWTDSLHRGCNNKQF